MTVSVGDGDITMGGIAGAMNPINPVTDWYGSGTAMEDDPWDDPSLKDFDNLNQQMNDFGVGVLKNGIIGVS